MAVPVLLSVFRVRMPDRSVLAKSVPSPSFFTASANVSVMLADASVTVAWCAGANFGAAGPVVSTVKVALAVEPWLPTAS